MTYTWKPYEIKIFRRFFGRCARCQRNTAITLHHIEPKSLRPDLKDDPDNQIPLCHECHLWAHAEGTKNSADELKALL